jgi:hypothetical protein
MKCEIAVLVLLAGSFLAKTSSHPSPMPVCDVLHSVARYSGRIITLSGFVPSPRALQLYDPACGRISFEYAEDSGISPKPNFKTIRDDNFKKFEDSLPELIPPPPHRPARVHVVVEGRFDAASVMHQRGFGHLELFDYRLVIRRIVSVQVEPASLH